ncbi:MAG TPA: thymidine phosphorylase [Gemmatimonadota bacterium]|nr:thymidine phosphorylase [Gemmatimonadota bacterium]
MNPVSVIRKKRDGGSLSSEEWAAFFSGYLSGEVSDYHVSALLMAVFFQGMDPEETRALTRIMIDSGETWSWEGVDGPVADKHSTGGVGDKVSIPLAPLVAACGVKVPMVSGRGLGHTGGTLDKLESIPGYRVDLSRADFERLLRDVGYGMGGQTGTFAPLDREVYALRDVTATVESIPLITASIMSKKIAEGVSALVSDVKWGDGAFIRAYEDAELLARGLIEIGAEFGVRVEALMTRMDVPLGRTVGHALEIKESIALLRGEEADERLLEVVTSLAGRMLILTGLEKGEAEATHRVEEALSSGRALELFRDNVEAQGGDPRVTDDPSLLPSAPVRREIQAPADGWLAGLPAREVGYALIEIGGGRRVKGAEIDRAVGFELVRRPGEEVTEGDAWCVVHARKEDDATAAAERLAALAVWSAEPVELPPVVTKRIAEGR